MTIYYPIFCPICREPNGDNIERLRIWDFKEKAGGIIDFQCWNCHRNIFLQFRDDRHNWEIIRNENIFL